MLRRRSAAISADPLDTLFHLANGEITHFVSEDSDELVWHKLTHRGVQFLDHIDIPRKEKRYVFSPKFEIRYDTAFDECLDACAAPRDVGRPWLCPELQAAYRQLHRMGYAHSYEAWQGDQLAGGCIGIQIGAWITCESMFHRVSNASKAAWGQTLLRLKDRGFTWVDVAEVAEHHVNYGEQWIPQWKFDKLQRLAMRQHATLADHLPCPRLPLSIAMELETARIAGAFKRRFNRLFAERLPNAVTPMVTASLFAI